MMYKLWYTKIYGLVILLTIAQIAYSFTSYYLLENAEGKQVLILGDRYGQLADNKADCLHIDLLLQQLQSNTMPLPCFIEGEESIEAVFKSKPGKLHAVTKAAAYLGVKMWDIHSDARKRICFTICNTQNQFYTAINALRLTLETYAQELKKTAPSFPSAQEWHYMKLNLVQNSPYRTYSLEQYFKDLEGMSTELRPLKDKYRTVPFSTFCSLFEQGKERVIKIFGHLNLQTSLEMAILSFFDECKTADSVIQKCVELTELTDTKTVHLHTTAVMLHHLLTLTEPLPHKVLTIVHHSQALALTSAYTQLGYSVKNMHILSDNHTYDLEFDMHVLKKFTEGLTSAITSFLSSSLNITQTAQPSALEIPQLGTNSHESPQQAVSCNTCSVTDKKLLFCEGCKGVQYCSIECQKADWLSHKRVCKLTYTTRQEPILSTQPLKQCAYCNTSGKKFSLCGRCQKVQYCNKKCQTEHWLTHKPNCKKG